MNREQARSLRAVGRLGIVLGKYSPVRNTQEYKKGVLLETISVSDFPMLDDRLRY